MSLKRDEIANPESCLNKAADDEPIFVLRSNDPCAAKIVRKWADEYVLEKTLASMDGVLTNRELAKAQEARGLANMMDAWRFQRRHEVSEPQLIEVAAKYPCDCGGTTGCRGCDGGRGS